MPTLGTSDLDVSPLCLGGNVFGWTADEEQSFAVLDAFLEAGGNFIDTADSYSAFAPGNSGGESETVLGKWFAARGNRDQVILATKVGRHPDFPGLSADNINTAVRNSLERLQTDYIDVYWAHADDPDTPLQETLRTFDELVTAGTVRHIAASNYSAPRLREALELSEREGLAGYIAVQPEYSLVARDDYEGDLQHLCLEKGLGCVPYWALARGFLTGKYRPDVDVDSARAGQVKQFMDERGLRILGVLDEISAAHGTSVAAVTLAWTAAQPGIASVLGSARTVDQFDELLAMVDLTLTEDELNALTEASETVQV